MASFGEIKITVEPEAQDWLERLERVRADLATIKDMAFELDAERENADRLRDLLSRAYGYVLGEWSRTNSKHAKEFSEDIMAALQRHEARRG